MERRVQGEEEKEIEECVDAGPVIMVINVTGNHVSAGRTSQTSWLFANAVFTAVCQSPELGQICFPLCTALFQGL
jgi:hypothetical protein